ncbi:MAG: M20 family metallo-hydrolase [Anaerolineae bacterium]|jgi:N-carbamoyl-L-amino-acid hydrolase|nr:M20 family metallo-hydrolase [Anaerolineae bacterium]
MPNNLSLTIDAARLQAEIDTLATYSDAPAPAVTRILFTPTELEARDYVRGLMREAALSLREDAVGNIFGRWEGADDTLPAVATGSHIDAIPFSGKYDGVVGVLGAIEAVRALRQAGFTPQRPIELIMFTAEEPTRFKVGCLGSRALAGKLSPVKLLDLTDGDGNPFDAVRRQAGYIDSLDDVELPGGHYDSFVELHIEQGPRLEAAKLPLGVVTAIAAPATVRVQFEGSGGHAGTVLMPDRRDALPAAAELILSVEKIAQSSTSPDAVATVGLCHIYPGAVNSIASRVYIEVDIRDIDLTSRNRMVDTVVQVAKTIAERRKLEYEVVVLNADDPCTCGREVIGAVVESIEALGYPYQTMVSRAYHDTLFMADLCPTTMIFVPSQNGYSHRPDEYTAPEDIARGVEVLAHTLARLAGGTE